ncbi:hypothetical protein MHX53_03570 [Brevibacterium sp. ACRRH]|uniref:hypothetical protein n=1 Tax=Brevibacterium sp. ACRRH TaxID=2918183 RepID=UPI001EF47A8C|nr:hypothetical protein [Brevibacterium sp. ACRRH]MCG7298137.1 hypothetical protein [Brevibacterium sp. ACRRH]
MDSNDIMYELTHIRAELQSLRREVASLRRHLGDVDQADSGEKSGGAGKTGESVADQREPQTHSDWCTPSAHMQELLGDFLRDFPFAQGEDPRPSRRAGFSAEPQEPPRPESRPSSYPGAAEIAKFISDALAERDRRGRGGQDSDDTGRAEDGPEDEPDDSDDAK